MLVEGMPVKVIWQKVKLDPDGNIKTMRLFSVKTIEIEGKLIVKLATSKTVLLVL